MNVIEYSNEIKSAFRELSDNTAKIHEQFQERLNSANRAFFNDPADVEKKIEVSRLLCNVRDAMKLTLKSSALSSVALSAGLLFLAVSQIVPRGELCQAGLWPGL